MYPEMVLISKKKLKGHYLSPSNCWNKISVARWHRYFPAMSRFLQNKDLFAVVSCELSNVAILPKSIESHFAGCTSDISDLKFITFCLQHCRLVCYYIVP